MAEEALASEGHTVSGCDSGENLMEQVIADGVDLLLLDRSLPETDPYGICRQILEHPGLSATKVVILAGPLDVVDGAKAEMAGAYTVLTKPLFARDLTGLVGKLGLSVAAKEPDLPTRESLVDSLVHGALSQESIGPSYSKIRESVETVVMASVPMLVDRITDQLANRLKNRDSACS